MPSVGTWLAHRIIRYDEVVENAAAVPTKVDAAAPTSTSPAPVAATVKSILMPSVGTWLVHRIPYDIVGNATVPAQASPATPLETTSTSQEKPQLWYKENPRPEESVEICRQMRNMIEEQDKELKELKKQVHVAQYGVEPTPAPSKQKPPGDERLRMEALTILQQATASGKVEEILKKAASVDEMQLASGPKPVAVFQRMASVGTWIARKPFIDVSPARCPSKAIMDLSITEVENMDHSELIRKFKEELRRREEEIQALKTQLGPRSPSKQ
jgi:hypothetical protein